MLNKFFDKHNKLHLAFLVLIAPGVLGAWFLLLLPFYIWDSISEDWVYNFKSDIKPYFGKIKELWNGS